MSAVAIQAVPSGKYNPRAPIGYMRRAPVLHKPIVGKEAIRHAALALAEMQAKDEQRRSDWQQHVWQENLKQTSTALSRGAVHAFRNQKKAQALESELEAANDRLHRAEQRMAKTEYQMRDMIKQARQKGERRRTASAAVHGRRESKGPTSTRHPPNPTSSVVSFLLTQTSTSPRRLAEQLYEHQRAESIRAAAPPQHALHVADLDDAALPAWVPGAGDPKPMPTTRWATKRVPAETSEMHHRRAPTKPQLKANRVPVSRDVMLNGAGARDALAPPDGWDGPYRARRPEGLIGPKELVVGLAQLHQASSCIAPSHRGPSQRFRPFFPQ